MERAIRQVNCPLCLADVDQPCVSWPSRKPATLSHNVRYWQARIAGILPSVGISTARLIL